MQGECLALLQSRDAVFLAGNAEREVLAGANERDRWCRAQLTAGQRAFVASWPATITREVSGVGTVCCCHASPRADDEILTMDTPDAACVPALAGADAGTVVVGHTHHQFDRDVGGVRLVNAGSVGLPYQGVAAAFWALIGPDVVMCRTDYDVPAALARLRAAAMPGFDEMVSASLVTPITARQAAQTFERQAGRGR